MELKLDFAFRPFVQTNRFNRTFMELKQNTDPFEIEYPRVLIGPSWN